MEFVSSVEEANAILYGMPIDQGSENKGTSLAPERVRRYFDQFFFPESGNVRSVMDVGDITEENTFEETMDKIYERTLKLFGMKRTIVGIGGNHSVSFPIVKAMARYYDNIGIIFIDAHPDCQPGYFPYGDVFGNIHSLPEVKKSVLVGIRNWSKDEYNFIKRNKIPVMRVGEFNIERIKRLMEGLDVYVSIDIDAVDPAFAPGTGWREPGGFSSREIINIVRRIAKLNIKGFDLVEVNPKIDVNDITSILGAKIIFEFVNSLP